MTRRNEPGRPVVLAPNPRGLWTILSGALVAALAPLFGFLIGSTLERPDSAMSIDPIFLWLTVGLLVGACGAVIALIGIWRLLTRRRRQLRGSDR